MSAPVHPDSTDLDRLHSAVKREKADQAPENAPAPMWASFLLMIIAVIAGGQPGPNLGSFKFADSNPYPQPTARDDVRPKGCPLNHSGPHHEKRSVANTGDQNI